MAARPFPVVSLMHVSAARALASFGVLVHAPATGDVFRRLVSRCFQHTGQGLGRRFEHATHRHALPVQAAGSSTGVASTRQVVLQKPIHALIRTAGGIRRNTVGTVAWLTAHGSRLFPATSFSPQSRQLALRSRLRSPVPLSSNRCGPNPGCVEPPSLARGGLLARRAKGSKWLGPGHRKGLVRRPEGQAPP